MRLELTRSNDHYPLKVARLPIPPSGQMLQGRLRREVSLSEKRDSNPRPRPWQGRALPPELFSHILKDLRAKNGTRTRDPDLGKVVLYQLSYFRNFALSERLSLVCGYKISTFYQTYQIF